jgi:hypothetical protein
VDPVPDPLLLRKSGIAGNRTRTSGSVTRNSDHKTTEAVEYMLIKFMQHSDVQKNRCAGAIDISTK